jgi:hypothetical protein
MSADVWGAPVLSSHECHGRTMKDEQPAYDAESAASEKLRKAYRAPPGIHFPPGRATLLIGSRGSGKTTLLRNLRHTYDGVAIYGDLGRKILIGVSQDSGAAGLTMEPMGPEIEGRLQDKSLCLLAFWVADQCKHRGISTSTKLLQQMLPDSIKDSVASGRGLITWMRQHLHSSDLSVYRRVPQLQPFLDYLYDTKDRVFHETGKQLLFLLDRAEEIPYPSLSPVLTMLDQSHPFITVVACRPGVLGTDPYPSTPLPSPGDHYDVRHLGAAPYSAEWEEYRREVLNAWIPNVLNSVPKAHQKLLLQISRDSLRSALELLYNSVEGDKFSEVRSFQALGDLQAMLMNAAQGQLRRLNDRLSGLIDEVRKAPGFFLPTLLSLKQESQPLLLRSNSSFPESSRIERLVRLGLRVGLFATENGVSWHPYITLDTVELQPLLLWRKGDKWRTQ